MHIAGVRLWYIAAAINVGSAKLTRIHIDPATQFFVDEAGRARIFHGVNAVEKVGGVFFDMFRMDSPSLILRSIDGSLHMLRWRRSTPSCQDLMYSGVSPQ